MSQDNTPKIKKFDPAYNIRTCVKCGRILGAKLTYNEPTDRLIVRCCECGYTYDMHPKVRKEGGGDETR